MTQCGLPAQRRYEQFTIFVDQATWVKSPARVVEQLRSTRPERLAQLQANLRAWQPVFDYRDPSGTLNSVLAAELVALTRNRTALALRMGGDSRPQWADDLLAGYNGSTAKGLRRERRQHQKFMRASNGGRFGPHQQRHCRDPA